MFYKLALVAGIIGAVIVSSFVVFALVPVYRSLAQIAIDAPTTGNYTGYHEALTFLPLLFLGIPFLVGVVYIVIVLRRQKVSQ